MMIFAQAMLEKISLDGMSAGLAQFRYQATELLQNERALIAIAVGAVLVLVWRMRR
jgi:hypothetical protein